MSESEYVRMKLRELIAALRGHKEEERIVIMADIQVSITINVVPAVAPLAVDASGVPAKATVGVPYTGAIKASGGTPPYTFKDTGGALPAGLVLNADGTITGTPTAVGSTTDAIDVSDSGA